MGAAVLGAHDMKHTVRVLHLYDRYLNIYADRGNIQVLSRRCTWRGIGIEVVGLGLDDTFNADDVDLIYVGGGQDRDQRMIADRMASGPVGAEITRAVAAGAALLAVCGGYQLLGSGYHDVSGADQPGVGLFRAATTAQPGRLIGNVAITAQLPNPRIAVPSGLEWDDAQLTHSIEVAGFENHAGRTTLADGARPLGEVINGHGNDGRSGFEGCIVGRALGTYLHGPLLPRNPELADWLIEAALVHRYGDDAPQLDALDDPWSARARSVVMDRARHG